MTVENQTGEKVDFSGSQASDYEKKLKSPRRNIKIAVAVFGVILLLAVVATTLVYFLKERSSRPLAEVNLEEGDTMVYRVDQNLEVRVGDVQKGTITAVVALRVTNKTSDEYWFLMKINITFKGGDVDVKGLKAMKSDVFLVRLQIPSRTQSKAGENGWSDGNFELYGNAATDGEFIRYVYGILYQLLPALRRDLYEDIDGKKDDSKKERTPERSPLLPGDVNMHREANTFDKNKLYIKNHFNRSDLVNVSSEIDLDMTYVDYSSINKSNGMVSESHAYLSEQLYFGEPIHTKSGFDVTMLNVTLFSHVSLIDTDSRLYFGYAETKGKAFHLFTKLTVPKSEVSFGDIRESSNSSQTLANDSTNIAAQNFTKSSSVPVIRSRRSSSSTASVAWRQAEPLHLSQKIEKTFIAFSKNVIGISIKGYGKISLTVDNPIKIECSLHLTIGSIDITLLSKTIKAGEIKNGKPSRTRFQWEPSVTISVPVLFLHLDVHLEMAITVDIDLNFPPEKNSLNPVKFAVEVEPYAEATATIDGHLSAFLIQAGVTGEGTLLRVGFPVTLSYDHGRSSQHRWCLASSVNVNALELSAWIFYQFWTGWTWGTRQTLFDYGKTDGISNNWEIFSICSL